MSISAKPFGHHSYVPPPSFIVEARLRALARSTKTLIVTINRVEAVEVSLVSYLDIWAQTDEGSDLRVGLWTRNWEAPSAVWRDLPLIHQLCDIAGRQFGSLAEMAKGLRGLRFQATCVLDRLASDNLEVMDIIAAAPIPEAADAPIR